LLRMARYQIVSPFKLKSTTGRVRSCKCRNSACCTANCIKVLRAALQFTGLIEPPRLPAESSSPTPHARPSPSSLPSTAISPRTDQHVLSSGLLCHPRSWRHTNVMQLPWRERATAGPPSQTYLPSSTLASLVSKIQLPPPSQRHLLLPGLSAPSHRQLLQRRRAGAAVTGFSPCRRASGSSPIARRLPTGRCPAPQGPTPHPHRRRRRRMHCPPPLAHRAPRPPRPQRRRRPPARGQRRRGR
jgi:hypothetical protein